MKRKTVEERSKNHPPVHQTQKSRTTGSNAAATSVPPLVRTNRASSRGPSSLAAAGSTGRIRVHRSRPPPPAPSRNKHRRTILNFLTTSQNMSLPTGRSSMNSLVPTSAGGAVASSGGSAVCTASGGTTPFRLSPPPHVGTLKYRQGPVPLPRLKWADEQSVWNLMCWKDTVYCRNPHLLQQHPSIQPKMRAILIDWLSEVCEEFKLHRETFYLAVDFVDRFLSKEKAVQKESLQLVGVTALFLAAKLEEIYPPKRCSFADITAGACTVKDIEEMELHLLKALNWALYPITVVHWITIYLQIIDNNQQQPDYYNYSNLDCPNLHINYPNLHIHRHNNHSNQQQLVETSLPVLSRHNQIQQIQQQPNNSYYFSRPNNETNYYNTRPNNEDTDYGNNGIACTSTSQIDTDDNDHDITIDDDDAGGQLGQHRGQLTIGQHGQFSFGQQGQFSIGQFVGGQLQDGNNQNQNQKRSCLSSSSSIDNQCYPTRNRDFVYSRYHRYHFIHIAQLIDLCMLDIGSLQFSYSVLAASAFAHIMEPENLALRVSGFKYDDIAVCYHWMTPFARVVEERGEIHVKMFADIADDDVHNIQTHVVDLQLLERAHILQQEMLSSARMSPVLMNSSMINIFPTPPQSDERRSVPVHNNSSNSASKLFGTESNKNKNSASAPNFARKFPV